MYKFKNMVYLSDSENTELKNQELYLTKVNHVRNTDEIPDSYKYSYTVGVDIDLI